MSPCVAGHVSGRLSTTSTPSRTATATRLHTGSFTWYRTTFEGIVFIICRFNRRYIYVDLVLISCYIFVSGITEVSFIQCGAKWRTWYRRCRHVLGAGHALVRTPYKHVPLTTRPPPTLCRTTH